MVKTKRLSKSLLILLTASIFIGLHLFVAVTIVLTLLFCAFSTLRRCFFYAHSMILNKRLKDKNEDITPMWSSRSVSVKYIAVGNTQRIIDPSESTEQLTGLPSSKAKGLEDTLKIIWINR